MDPLQGEERRPEAIDRRSETNERIKALSQCGATIVQVVEQEAIGKHVVCRAPDPDAFRPGLTVGPFLDPAIPSKKIDQVQQVSIVFA